MRKARAMDKITCRRLRQDDSADAQVLFTLMAEVFEEESARLPAAYLNMILTRADIWIIAAFEGDAVVGGLTGYVLPMTRQQMTELFIYDVAVRADRQRRGIGRALLWTTRAMAADQGLSSLFVPAENEDLHALDFYRALGGAASAVTFFTFACTRAG